MLKYVCRRSIKSNAVFVGLFGCWWVLKIQIASRTYTHSPKGDEVEVEMCYYCAVAQIVGFYFTGDICAPLLPSQPAAESGMRG